MIQRLSPALSRGDGDTQILSDLGLTDKIIKPPRTEASIKRDVLSAWFTRYNTLYFDPTPRIAGLLWYRFSDNIPMNNPIIPHLWLQRG